VVSQVTFVSRESVGGRHGDRKVRRRRSVAPSLGEGSGGEYHGHVKKEFASRLAAAIEEVTAAEAHLTTLFREIRLAPRAEKTTVSKAVEEALARLSAARTSLLDLQLLVPNDEPPPEKTAR
jgi:hypothetical protein